jgi:TetR/AcrR family transcriptional regulator, transcriptional repressor for nem operon
MRQARATENRTGGMVNRRLEMKKGAETRERILDIAEAAVLDKGFAATSIDEIIAEAGITKSGFFYHFRDKNELALQMVDRFIETNNQLCDDIFARGRELSDDPLQGFLIGLKLLAETLAEVKSKHPGCIVASVCYQERLFDRKVVERTRTFTVDWMARFRGYLAEIAETYPVPDAELDDLAESLVCMIEGGITLSKVMGDVSHLERQVMSYRNIVRMVFTGRGPARARSMLLAAE